MKEHRKKLKQTAQWSKLVSSVPSIPHGNKMLLLAEDADEGRSTEINEDEGINQLIEPVVELREHESENMLNKGRNT